MTTEDSARQRILQTAGPLFARVGFQAATVREICDAAQVNLASINYYFGDKNGLYLELVKLAKDEQERGFPYREFALPQDPEQRLRDFIRVILSRLAVGSNGNWQVQLLVREFLQPGEATRTIVEAHFRPYFEMLMATIRQLTNGRLSESKLYQAGFSIIGQCLHYRLAGPIVQMFVSDERMQEDFSIDHLAQHIAEFTLGGLNRLIEAPEKVAVDKA